MRAEREETVEALAVLAPHLRTNLEGRSEVEEEVEEEAEAVDQGEVEVPRSRPLLLLHSFDQEWNTVHSLGWIFLSSS